MERTIVWDLKAHGASIAATVSTSWVEMQLSYCTSKGMKCVPLRTATDCKTARGKKIEIKQRTS